MNDTLLLLLNCLLIAVETITLFLLGCCFFRCRYYGIKLCFSLLALFAASVLIFLIAQGRTGVKLLLLVICGTLWLTLVFRPHIAKSFTVCVLFISVLTAVDSFFLIGFCAITGQDTQAFFQSPYAYYAYCYLMKVVELFLILILRLALRKRVELQAAKWYDWVWTLMFPAMSLLLALFLMQIYLADNSAAPQILACSVILILTDILAIILLNYMNKQQQRLHDYSILKHSIKMEQDNVTAWMNAYTNQRKQTHEFQNQLYAIRGLAMQETPQGKLIQYINQLLQTDLSNSMFVKTGRSVVDVILNQKNAIAQSKGIELQVQLDDLTDFALTDNDLVVVLSNLIDNAIEACEKIRDTRQRIIRLDMQAAPEVNFLSIENPTAEAVRIVDNEVVSTKGSRIEHGYGLKNISTILSQYNAIYVLDYQEELHRFCFSAQIIPPGQ